MLSKRRLLIIAASMLSLAAFTSSVAASSPRSGDLHVEKECSTYVGQAGGHCTITASNLKAIEVGSTITYLQAADFGAGTLNTDIVLDPPGPGNNTAFGHCEVNLVTGFGSCTLSGGTGKFTRLSASVEVTPVGGVNWEWDGPFSFSPLD